MRAEFEEKKSLIAGCTNCGANLGIHASYYTPRRMMLEEVMYVTGYGRTQVLGKEDKSSPFFEERFPHSRERGRRGRCWISSEIYQYVLDTPLCGKDR